MVIKSSKVQEPPPKLDEGWWAALLRDEEKYNHRVPDSAPQRDVSVEQVGAGYRSMVSNVNIDWQQVQQLFDQDTTISLDVTGYNRGGLLVGMGGLHGFVPVSHLIDISCQMDEAMREQIMLTYMNRSISVKVIECDEERGRVVYSERAALAACGRRNELFCDVKPGDIVYGAVTNITDFGIFVDLGGVEGLVHVSELSWGRVRHPSDVANVGHQVKSYVLQVDKERSRIALSLKRLHPNPWDTAEQRYQPGQLIEVTITSLVPFGAFARLEEGLDGLIHATQISASGENDSLKGLEEGQVVRARVLNVDSTRQRLGLSLRLTEP
ncbi:MAG: S1 RNA-binding domain-containing protein [Anaerolineales bacterium]|nr:S1 RNA-binding domain-containing protein [Anaerolineales bacterium]